MRIDARKSYCGFDMIEIRNLLRDAGDIFGLRFIQSFLGVDSRKAREVLDALIADRMVEASADRVSYYHLTVAGSQLAKATAAPKVKRKTAEKAVREFLERVEIVNTSPDYLFSVKQVKVFGSFLGDAEFVSDVDLCVTLKRKHNLEQMRELSDAQICAEIKKGRDFMRFIDQIGWPEKKVWLFLKSRSRVLSLENGDDPILERTKWEYLYLEDVPTTRSKDTGSSKTS